MSIATLGCCHSLAMFKNRYTQILITENVKDVAQVLRVQRARSKGVFPQLSVAAKLRDSVEWRGRLSHV